ncbi:sulfotransferase family protein [Bacillus thuringiensis]|uniref:sulfotransferase-like domain-containing protein n=1 Tax=Bacillus thuringiensis TaxID=1428 RepID=UPI000BEBB48E|nr:sulfotransferase family protein [Bacillus thuringiensis]MED3053022.1 hypothetical protein [Bacillus thuringiensis]PEA16652.1 sulfotransferase family protein [Bacillus thuringiensis]PFH77306.1 sulfotransferase family protein [Bacillus thuringiensis]
MKTNLIMMWGVPRSVSTAFEKTFSQRSDTTTIHEPFAECYYYGPDRVSDRYMESNEREYSKAAALNTIYANKSPLVFVKDLAFQSYHFVDDELLKKSNNAFIIRHPHKVFSSLVKLKPDFTEQEFGFTALEILWNRVKNLKKENPILIEGERFQKEPRKTLLIFCEKLGIEYQDKMLEWENGKLNNWKEEDNEIHGKWHKNLENSKTISFTENLESDLSMNSEQKEIVNRAMEIYNKLITYSIN